MKPEYMLKAVSLLLLSFFFQSSFASGGNIMGQVTSAQTNEPVGSATVVLICQGVQKIYETNDSGYYYASNIPAGRYDIIVSFMSTKDTTPGIKVSSDETKTVDIKFGTTHIMPEAHIIWNRHDNPPLIKIDEPTTLVITSTTLRQDPAIKKITDVIATTSGVVEMGGNSYVHGSRADGLAYYIDQCKVTGNPNVPICGVDVMRVYDNFIPAKYGDSIGGVVVIETRSLFTE